MTDVVWDVVVVGAGAAGLLAAVRAAERGRRVLLLEKNRKPGVKILMSGGTRCNLTHATDNRGIVDAYGPPGRFLHSALAALSVQDTIDLFEAEGVAAKVEETGKIFPVSNKALDVLDALLRRLHRSGADAGPGRTRPRSSAATAGLRPDHAAPRRPRRPRHPDHRRPVVPRQRHHRRRLRLRPPPRPHHRAAAARPGADHRSTPRGSRSCAASRCPTWACASWKARRSCNPAAGRCCSPTSACPGRSSSTSAGSSAAIRDRRRSPLEIDLLPGGKEADLDEASARRNGGGGQEAARGRAVRPDLPRRLCDALLPQAGLPADRKAAALSRPERGRLRRLRLKRLRLPVTGTLGFGKAEVTAGGVALDEVDSRTMQSKRVPGLYIAGELLDLDGPIGGYNFQAAWSTGWLAGGAAADGE